MKIKKILKYSTLEIMTRSFKVCGYLLDYIEMLKLLFQTSERERAIYNLI